MERKNKITIIKNFHTTKVIGTVLDTKIKIFHVGGGDLNLGPVEKVIMTFPNLIELTIFEIRDSEDACFEKDISFNKLPLTVRFVNAAVGKKRARVISL